MKLTLTDANFDEEIKKATVPVLVDFYADWCGPCKMMEPVLEELEKEWVGKIVIGKLNVDDNQQTAAKFQVMSIPTLLIFKGGQVVKQLIGYQDKASLLQAVNSIS